MGCCFSSSAGPSSPYPGGAPDASSRAINPTTTEVESGRRRRRRHDAAPLDQHITRPLRRHVWFTTTRHWGRNELARERADFFDTRVTGRPEVWQALHAALQVLWEPAPESSGDDTALGLATAQSLLEAADISLPTGDLVDGVYDALGNLYIMPEWVVADPENMVEDGKQDLSVAGEDTAGEDEEGDDEDSDGGGDDDDGEDAGTRREEKGKGIIRQQEMITLRARLSDSGKDILITVQASNKVKNIVKKIATKTNFSRKNIRIAYMGKMLREDLTLQAQGWQPGHVINAMIFAR